MTHLGDTIAHILKHRQDLELAIQSTTQPEAITKQYVILPILRALGWNDTNLGAVEIVPEYKLGNDRADYALRVYQGTKVLIECRPWNDQLGDSGAQFGSYAFHTGAPIVILTNGKTWRFYFAWKEERATLNERLFCEVDVADEWEVTANLEKYLSKFNIESGQAEYYAHANFAQGSPSSDSAQEQKSDNSDSIGEVDDRDDIKPVRRAKPMPAKGNAKMTEDQVREIRARRETGETLTSLAKAFDMTTTGIHNIVKRNTWKHVE